MSILTAGEFIQGNEQLKEIVFYQDSPDTTDVAFTYESLQAYMVSFAKMHVEAALKAAADNAETYDYPYMYACPECGHTATYIKEESILNAYPLTNIK